MRWLSLNIMPKYHAGCLADLSEGIAAVLPVAMRIAGAIRQTSLRCGEGVNLFINGGEAAGQVIFHVHVPPRFLDDGFRLSRPAHDPQRRQLDSIAGEIASAMT